MSILIGLMTVLLILSSLFLGLLILIQLPKKEAGMGSAFGGGTTDALFGAGSGTALTHITKYTAATFLGLSLVLSVLQSRQAGSSSKNVLEKLEQKATTTSVVPASSVSPAPAAASNTLAVPSTTPAVTPVPATPAAPAPAPVK